MARKREPIFPLFEEVRRVTAALTDEQFGRAIRYALAEYYGSEAFEEPDTLTLFAATMLLEQAARYDRFRETQSKNAERRTAKVSQSQPKQAELHDRVPNTPPSPIPSPIPSPSPNIICSKAVRLLNELSGSSFRDSTKSTQALIAARLKDGFEWADIEAVISHQCRLWGQDEIMQKYLRPQTLFGTKFESYLSDARRKELEPRTDYVIAPILDPFEAALGKGEYYD